MCSPSQGYYQSSPPTRLRALPDKDERLRKANEFINIIATHGRMFFNHEGAISRLLLDDQGRIRFWDSHSRRYVYPYDHCCWKGFTNGGKMKRLVTRLREYIQGRIKTGDGLFMILPMHWPSRLGGMEELLDGHPWGYPEADMTIVIEAARRIFCTDKEATNGP